MNIYLADGGSLFRSRYETFKERGGEVMDVYLAGPEFVAGYIKRRERTIKRR